MPSSRADQTPFTILALSDVSNRELRPAQPIYAHLLVMGNTWFTTRDVHIPLTDKIMLWKEDDFDMQLSDEDRLPEAALDLNISPYFLSLFANFLFCCT